MEDRKFTDPAYFDHWTEELWKQDVLKRMAVPSGWLYYDADPRHDERYHFTYVPDYWADHVVEYRERQKAKLKDDREDDTSTGDALALWHRLGRVGDDGALGGRVADDADAAAWVRARGLDPVAIDAAGLARVLPLDGLDLPPWATRWATSGHRLILPVYDTDGVLAGVRARGVPARFGPRVMSPAGQRAAGLVLADDAGRLMLAGKAPAVREVWIVEGETDFLTLACADAATFRRGYRAPRRPSDGVAVLGVYAGAWGYSDTGRALAARIPADATVRIATDNDAEGDRYADDIATTLQLRGLAPRRGRCPEGDVNARWCALPVGRGAHDVSPDTTDEVR